MPAKPTTIDEYLATVRDDQRAALGSLRATIREAAPNAEECISYGVPAFRLDGRVLIGFGAKGGHCALYPFSGTLVDAHRALLSAYATSKGTIRFQPDHPLPAALVRTLLRARLAEQAGD